MMRATLAAILCLPAALASSWEGSQVATGASAEIEELAELLWTEEGGVDGMRALAATSDANITTTQKATEKATETTTAGPSTTKAAIAKTVKGSMTLTVSNPTAFAADPKVKTAIGKSIATLVNVPQQYVTVVLTVVVRRLSVVDGAERRLAGGVKVDYTIELPAAAPAGVTMTTDPATITSTLKATDAAALTTRLTTAIAAEGASYTVTVTAVGEPVVADLATTTTQPMQAPTSGGLRATSAGGTVALLLLLAAGGFGELP